MFLPYRRRTDGRPRSWIPLDQTRKGEDYSAQKAAESGENAVVGQGNLRGALLEFCRTVDVLYKYRKLATARSPAALPFARPLSVGFYDSVRMRFLIRQAFLHNRYDAVFCYSSPMAQFVRTAKLPSPAPARVMDFVDVDSDKWRQYAEHKSQPMKAVYQLEATLLARYERVIAEEFDASVLVSAEEAKAFSKIAPRARQVVGIPNGVDTEFFGATVRKPAPATAPLFVFVGQMDYFANVDGVTHFAQDILPMVRASIPQARFQIVGRAPTAEVEALAKLPGVEVTGGVPDIRDYLGGATIMVAPLRIARGIQNKVLEAMAARVPVVAAPNAFEGIEGEAGVHALVCDEPGGYAEALIDLVGDPARQRLLADNARKLVEQSYAWAPAMQRLEDLIAECVARR